jgi:tetratricopeptide (TPR) repeat protein
MSRLLARLPLLAMSVLIPLAAACVGSDEPKTTSAGVTTPTVTATSTEGEAPVVAGSTGVPAVSYEVAESAFTAGHYPEATELFTAYTTSRPENPWGYYMLGMSAWKAGDTDKASSAFDQALQLDPGHRKSLFNSSRVLLEAGRPKEALERVEKALSQEPMSNEGLRLLGRVRYELGQVDGAIEAYQRALTIDERDVWAMNNLGLIYIQQNRSPEALAPLARAVEIRSNAPVFQNNLGTALERSGYPTAAAQAYEAAIAVDSTYAKASVGLARVTGGGQAPETTPVDLPGLSHKFQTEIESWRSSPEAGDSGSVPAAGDSTTVSVESAIDSAVISGGELRDTLEDCAPEL